MEQETTTPPKKQRKPRKMEQEEKKKEVIKIYASTCPYCDSVKTDDSQKACINWLATHITTHRAIVSQRFTLNTINAARESARTQ